MQEDETAIKMLTGKATGKRPLGRPREDNIKMNIREIWRALKCGVGGEWRRQNGLRK
jgi:hypothetical protein